MEKIMQVNLTERVDGTREYWTSIYSEDGYVGQLVDTVYADGADTTDWCLFVGTQDECESYITSAKGVRV